MTQSRRKSYIEHVLVVGCELRLPNNTAETPLNYQEY